MKNLIFVLAAMLLFSCSDDDKDYGLPPEVPGEVQSDDFRSIREDLILLCCAAIVIRKIGRLTTSR